MRLISKVLLTILFLSTSYSWAALDFLKNSNWQNYVTILNFYHRFNPNVYPSLELLPLNKIPTDTFQNEINQTSQSWEQFEKSKKGTLADRQTQIKLSRDANERLLALLPKNEKNPVTLKKVIDSIPKGARTAMTPLDPIFWNSVIGKKVSADLIKIKKDPSQVQEVQIRSDKGTIHYCFETDATKESDRYSVKLVNNGTTTLKVKGKYNTLTSPASDQAMDLDQDSTLKVFDLKGAFYKKQNDPSPFGAYPPDKDVYIGEDGNPHFKGDGHKHFF